MTQPADHTQGDQAFRADSLYGRQEELNYGGALSFLRRRYTRDIAGADVVVSGIPFDSAVSYRPGTRFGPQAIRAASAQLAELYAFPWGFDPFDHLAVADYGDCFLDFGHPEHVAEQIRAHARGIIDQGPRMLTLGGDHFITYGLLKAHAEVHGPLALVQVDAHPDTWADDGDRIDHGTMLARAVRENLIDVENSIQIGIRTVAPDCGFTILDAPWVHEQGIDAVLERVHATVGDRPVYLTWDIDSLDPAFAPGTGTPVCGGLTSAQALKLLRNFGTLDPIGMDIVEVSPPYDHAEVTALMAATLGHDYLCLLADHRRAKA